jgi:hypothetical protein
LAGELVLGFQLLAVVHAFVVPTHVEVIVAPCAGAKQSTRTTADATHAAALHDRCRKPLGVRQKPPFYLEVNPTDDPGMCRAMVPPFGLYKTERAGKMWHEF